MQQPNHVTKLFDANGDLVSETQDAPRYAVLMATGQTYVVEEDQYKELEKLLLK